MVKNQQTSPVQVQQPQAAQQIALQLHSSENSIVLPDENIINRQGQTFNQTQIISQQQQVGTPQRGELFI